MARVCVLLAPGFEEIEAVTLVDVLRRADVEVVTLGVAGTSVTGSHGITVTADRPLAGARDERWDMVVLPGGMPGSANLRDDPHVQALVKAQHEAGRRLAAICAAPIALAAAGVLRGRQVTSYPTCEAELGEVRYRQRPVVVDGNVFTSRAPGTALPFALRLVAELAGEERAAELAEAMLVDRAAVTA